MNNTEFFPVETPVSHFTRRVKIIKEHPEVKKLFGPNPLSMLWIVGLVLIQVLIGISMIGQPWWVFVLTAYIPGAIITHALFVQVHEATHNLIFKSIRANRIACLTAGLSLIVPGAMGFRKYHLLHHKYLGNPDYDADLAKTYEADIVGTSPWRKMLWIISMIWIQAFLRPLNLKDKSSFIDRDIILNILVNTAFVTPIWIFFGGTPIIYMLISMLFSIGMHPLGARWIQEHYVFRKGQETYSYYGLLNKVCFNMGYHNEHHDMILVPWNNLPKVRALAPEYYNNLYYHTSWVKLLFRFIFDRNVRLTDRIIRSNRTQSTVSPEWTDGDKLQSGLPLQEKLSNI